MVSQAATPIHEALSAKLAELGDTLDGISEAQADQPPSEGEWSCKEALSHLSGEEGDTLLDGLHRILAEDNPLIDVTPGLSYFTPERRAMSLSQLRAGVWRQYEDMAALVAGLGDEQLARQARIPLLKETPIGEDATLEQWLGAIVNLHLAGHVEQMRALRQALDA